MKKIIFIFLVLLNYGLANAEAPAPSAGLPFKVSANTTDQAVWYLLETKQNDDNANRAWSCGDDGLLHIDWTANPDPATAGDDHLFCFIGDNVNGFSVYNKTTGELKLQNFSWDEANQWDIPIGFTDDSQVSGTDLMNVWKVVEGDGSNHDGDAVVGYYKVYSATKTGITWRTGGGSILVTAPADWGDLYSYQFVWAKGQGAAEALSMVSSTPGSSAANVALNANVAVTFNQDITLASDASATIKDADNNAVNGVSLSVNGASLIIAHNDFEGGKVYTVNIPAGTVEGQDAAISWSFTTTAAPAPSPGLPFKVSANTTDQAVWYLLETKQNDDNANRAWSCGDDGQLHIDWTANPDPATAGDDHLFCFMGDNVNGFSVYNKTTGELKIQNFSWTDDNPDNQWDIPIGFTADSQVSGDDLMNVWKVVEGNGSNHDGVEAVGYYKVYSATKTGITWRTGGASTLVTAPANWGDLYSYQFVWAKGQGEGQGTGTVNMISVTPKADATNVAINAGVTVTFDQDITLASGASATIKDADNNAVEGVALSVSGAALTIAHNDFENGKVYTVNVPAGTVEGQDAAISWSFTTILQGTETEPAPSAGLPFKVSANTTDQAAWYLIIMDHNDAKADRAWYIGDDGLGHMDWNNHDPYPTTDEYLFCFVGDNTNGFSVYNKSTGELTLQNLTVAADLWNESLGFTADEGLVTGDDLMNLWSLIPGDGTNHDGVARTDRYKVYSTTQPNVSWWATGASVLGTAPANWGDLYCHRFAWVEGQGATGTMFTITVTGGTSDVTDAEAGATVKVTAGTPPTGEVFDHWESGDVTFADATNPVTTFVMPGNNVSVTAIFINTVGINAPSVQSDLNVYSEKGKLVVESGNATGAPFQVYAITGQNVAGGTLTANRQEVSLASGVYIVKAGNSIKKVIVK